MTDSFGGFIDHCFSANNLLVTKYFISSSWMEFVTDIFSCLAKCFARFKVFSSVYKSRLQKATFGKLDGISL